MELESDEYVDSFADKTQEELNKIVEKDLIGLRKMKEYYEDTQREKEKLLKVATKYNYGKGIDEISLSFKFFKSLINLLQAENYTSNKLQLTELISLLQSCRESDITISGIVSNPKAGEVKTQVKKVTLTSQQDIDYLYLWANKMLNVAQSGEYEYKFKWEFKEKKKRYDKYRIEFEDDYYIEPYTEDELNKIIQFEKSQKNTYVLTWGAEIGRCLSFLYNQLEIRNIFNAKKNKDKNQTSKGITNEYCFMYDCLVLLSVVEELYDNKEKYTKVKDWIRAFEIQTKKR